MRRGQLGVFWRHTVPAPNEMPEHGSRARDNEHPQTSTVMQAQVLRPEQLALAGLTPSKGVGAS